MFHCSTVQILQRNFKGSCDLWWLFGFRRGWKATTEVWGSAWTCLLPRPWSTAHAGHTASLGECIAVTIGKYGTVWWAVHIVVLIAPECTKASHISKHVAWTKKLSVYGGLERPFKITSSERYILENFLRVGRSKSATSVTAESRARCESESCTSTSREPTEASPPRSTCTWRRSFSL